MRVTSERYEEVEVTFSRHEWQRIGLLYEQVAAGAYGQGAVNMRNVVTWITEGMAASPADPLTLRAPTTLVDAVHHAHRMLDKLGTHLFLLLSCEGCGEAHIVAMALPPDMKDAWRALKESVPMASIQEAMRTALAPQMIAEGWRFVTIEGRSAGYCPRCQPPEGAPLLKGRR